MTDEKKPETALVKGPPEGSLQWYLDKPNYKGRLEEILGKHAPEFAASLIQIANSSTQLQKADPKSIIAAGMTAAVLRLPLDRNLGFAWIVPYNQSIKINGQWEKHVLAQFQMGYRGFRQLALRTGMYKDMNAGPVNAEALAGFNPVGNRIINWDKYDDDPSKAVGYFFAFELMNGFSKLVYWPTDKVKRHAERYSQNHAYHLKQGEQFKKDCRWCSDFASMAMKTLSSAALRAWGIMSVEMHDQMRFALQRDQAIQYDLDIDPIYPDQLTDGEEEPEPGKTNGEKAAAVAGSLKKQREGHSGPQPEPEGRVVAPEPDPELETETEGAGNENEGELSLADRQRTEILDLIDSLGKLGAAGRKEAADIIELYGEGAQLKRNRADEESVALIPETALAGVMTRLEKRLTELKKKR